MKGLIIQGFNKIEEIPEYKLNLIPQPQILYERTGFLVIDQELELIFQEVEAEEVTLERFKEELSFFGKITCKKINEKFSVDLEKYRFHPEVLQDETYQIESF